MNLKRINKIETSIKQQVQLESEALWANFTLEELDALTDCQDSPDGQAAVQKMKALHGLAILARETWLMTAAEYQKLVQIGREVKPRAKQKKYQKV
jgi:hypothetical protein